ncbi:type III polyketide synthase [Legionella hackeliae]|uniref:Putative Naringenin-chalcone synthase n=1 Tax=Legionella hackeliae TaxID=449 RepID=A0A0A8UVY7_LEGHA|nr:type III polyketide synthase [Legionella hackeliae]KTD15386.1 Naringenin-chalcone synthase [Legionella hackeliae]CEK11247.1 putative Naringenin-chalcone synthase [Legionella hackeliae]STX48012.1 Naringenin-chalcone synthase [Legionella hackeliae]
MQPAITAIGIANPPYKRSQQEIAALICDGFNLKGAQKRLVKAIYKASGIEQRYSVINDYCKSPGEFDFFPNEPDAPLPSTAKRMQLYKEHALKLALQAINDCLSGLAFNKIEITHLITVSCTGMYAPGLDIELVQHLELQSTTKRTAINFMGCYGAFNGIKIADTICRADPHANVLVVCVELCTIHFQRAQSMENVISNAIFADGAAAVLIQGKKTNPIYLSLESFHCDLVPQTSQEMAWQIADYGFDIVLSSYVPQAIKSGITQFSEKLLQTVNWSFKDIDYFAIHPGGLKILQACEEALSISYEDNKHSYEVLSKFGNMSSATILFVLKKIWNSLEKQDHGKNIFSCAFGPGLTLESMLLKTGYLA